MTILSVGGFDAYGISNTCLHRHWALEKCANYIEQINTVSPKSSLWYRIAYHYSFITFQFIFLIQLVLIKKLLQVLRIKNSMCFG